MNFYDSIIEGAQELPDAERGQLYAAVLEYLFYGREPEFRMRPTPRGMFVMLRPVLDNQRAQSERARKPRPSRRKRKADDGQGEAEGQPKQSRTPTEPEPNASRELAESYPNASRNVAEQQPTLFPQLAESYPNASEQEQEQEREKPPTDVGGKKSARRLRPFVPPTAEDVARVARERNLTLVDPEAFWAHYDAQGWVNGNGIPLASWESKLISWNSAERLRQQEARQGGAYDATYD